jgi:hypothetical protein
VEKGVTKGISGTLVISLTSNDFPTTDFGVGIRKGVQGAGAFKGAEQVEALGSLPTSIRLQALVDVCGKFSPTINNFKEYDYGRELLRSAIKNFYVVWTTYTRVIPSIFSDF